MFKAGLNSRNLVATSVALMFVVCQFFLAIHFHPSDSDPHKSGAAYTCAVCVVQASGHDSVGPLPSAPVLRVPVTQHFVGFFASADLLLSTLILSGKWARGPPSAAQ